MPPPVLVRQFWESIPFAYGAAALVFGWSTAESYLDLFVGNTPASVAQVPHAAARLAVMEWDARPATDDEMAQMTALVRE